MSGPFINLDSLQLAKVKQKIQDKTASERTKTAYKTLINYANHLLTVENPSVVNKTITAPNADIHDYVSLSRYWWPDPEKKDGLPWIRKDGETNPYTQTKVADRYGLASMSSGVRTLSRAYYFTGDERYAQKAASMIKTWFIDESTRMNPNLEFAQSIPGYPNTRPQGILDGRSIVLVVPDAINILSRSPHWTSDLKIKMNTWFTEYLTWLTDSNMGKKGVELDNNHGSWYKFQVASLALYLGNKPLVEKMVNLAQQSLQQQLNDQGGQIHEIARTKSFSYSCFNLNALTHIALIGDNVGMDMWHFKTKDGKSLSLAVDYLKPAIDGKTWPHPNIEDLDFDELVVILMRMSDHIQSNEYEDLLRKTINIVVEKEKTTGKKNEVLQDLSLLTDFTF